MKYEKLINDNSNKELSPHKYLTSENETKSKPEAEKNIGNIEKGIFKTDNISDKFVKIQNVEYNDKINDYFFYFNLLLFILAMVFLIGGLFIFSDIYYIKIFAPIFLFFLVLIYAGLYFYEKKQYKNAKNTEIQQFNVSLFYLKVYILFFLCFEFVSFLKYLCDHKTKIN